MSVAFAAALLAAAPVLPQAPSEPMQAAQDLTVLRGLRREFKRSTRASADSTGYALARFAVERLRFPNRIAGADVREYEAALREASKSLSAGTLAAVAARGVHPHVSEGFCRALLRERDRGSVSSRIDAQEEAAAEARDALERFGFVRGKELLDDARAAVTPAPGGGGASRSVYGIALLVPDAPESFEQTQAVRDGFRDGMRAGSGAWHGRFHARVVEVDATELGAARGVNEVLEWGGIGVVVVAGGSNPFTAAVAHGLGRGVVVIDARPSVEGFPGSSAEFPSLEAAALLPGIEFGAADPRPLPAFSAHLEYKWVPPSNDPQPARQRTMVPVLMRPPGTECGRRLAEVLMARAETRRIGIAVPDVGRDTPLVLGFTSAARALGRECVFLEYASGRRDYGPEVERFVESGAQALVLAGAAEESGEWLSALAARRLRPLVLGSSELSPDGFHAAVRRHLEGAVFVGRDWSDRRGVVFDRLSKMVPDPEQAAPGQGSEYRRGYRLGWLLSRTIVEGAITPTRLAEEIARRSLRIGSFGSLVVPVRSSNGTTPVRPEEVVVPLYMVKNGEAVPLPGF